MLGKKTVKSWLALIVVVALGLAWYGGWLQPAHWREAVAPTETLYRWKDDKGQMAYGTHPPAGKAAERVHAEDRMSVVAPPPARSTKAMPSPSASDVQDLKAKLMDKTIEGRP